MKPPDDRGLRYADTFTDFEFAVTAVAAKNALARITEFTQWTGAAAAALDLVNEELDALIENGRT